MAADVSIVANWRTLLLLLLALLPTVCDSKPKVSGILVAPIPSMKGSLGWQSDADGIFQQVEFSKMFRYNLFGSELGNVTMMSFSHTFLNGTNCQDPKLSVAFKILNVASDGASAYADAAIPLTSSVDELVYICGKMIDTPGVEQWRFLGRNLRVYVRKDVFPLWTTILLVITLFILSGLFSGLNLGLMALDINELRIICRAGTIAERSYAKRIIPVRKRGNFLLCSLLLGNVLVNTTLSLLMDSMTGDGLYAVISATLGIVIFGEIIPQALCSRHGLAIGAYTMPITAFFMLLTSPLSFPLSLVLDKVLGEEFGQVYDRNKLKEFIAAQNLEKTEANIILGALSLQNKTVSEVMRNLGEVYMLPCETVIDSFTIDQIRDTGYTRIPIYDKERSNIVNILNFKDLTIVSRDSPMRADLICEYFSRHVQVVYDTDTLDSALKLFLSNKIHLAIVKHHVGEDEGNDKDPYEVTVGLVTMEDILEEIIQEEIEDETDIPEMASASKQQARHAKKMWKDLAFSGTCGMQIPAQLRVAAAQSLAMLHSDLFGRNALLEAVLLRMFEEKVLVRHMFVHGDDENNSIYRRSEPANFGVFILEGRAGLSIGVESLEFEATAFTFLGSKALIEVREIHKEQPEQMDDMDSVKQLAQFVPDYTARAKQNMQYLKITQEQYAALLRISDRLRAEAEQLSPADMDDKLNVLFNEHFPKCKAPLPATKRQSRYSLAGFSPSIGGSPLVALANLPGNNGNPPSYHGNQLGSPASASPASAIAVAGISEENEEHHAATETDKFKV